MSSVFCVCMGNFVAIGACDISRVGVSFLS